MRAACTSLIGIWCCFLAVPAKAAESPVYEHLKDLECFIGSWESQSVIPESPAYSKTAIEWQGKPLLLRMNISWVAGKSAQMADTVFEVPGSVKINSATLWGWDQTVGKIKATRFT